MRSPFEKRSETLLGFESGQRSENLARLTIMHAILVRAGGRSEEPIGSPIAEKVVDHSIVKDCCGVQTKCLVQTARTAVAKMSNPCGIVGIGATPFFH